MTSYGALAESYDGLMADAAYRRRAKWLVKLFSKSTIPVQTVLDLGCGTGTIACLLAQRGYQVTATDLSVDMLTQAMQKADSLTGQPPLFLCQSMPRLRLLEPVDTVISTIDAINYLTRRADVLETFRRVYRYLKPGGQFIFDVNTPYKFQRMDGQMYTDESEESYCVWRTFFSEKQKICTYQVDLFRLTEDGTWERNYEEHRERAWSEAELRAFLVEAGFAKITLTGDLTHRPPKDTEDRWIFRCEKKADSITSN